MAACPKCGSNNVSIQIVQTGSVTNTKKKGCLYSLFRTLLIICTLGLWSLFGKKKEKSRTTYTNQKVAICQNCGHQWNVYTRQCAELRNPRIAAGSVFFFRSRQR